MHNFQTRVHHLYLIHQTTVDIQSLNPNQVKLKPTRVGRDFKAKKPELGFISFDLKADLSPLFNWNTKMLFVSVLAEFSNNEYKLNQACIWDDVIMNKEDAIFNLKNKKAEYPIHDLKDSLKGSAVNLTLQYQIVPWTGFFQQDRKVFKGALKF